MHVPSYELLSPSIFCHCISRTLVRVQVPMFQREIPIPRLHKNPRQLPQGHLCLSQHQRASSSSFHPGLRTQSMFFNYYITFCSALTMHVYILSQSILLYTWMHRCLLSGLPVAWMITPATADDQLSDVQEFAEWVENWGGGLRGWAMAQTLQKLKTAHHKGKKEILWQK